MMTNNNIKQVTYRALLWSFIDRGGEQIIRFAFSILMARLLLPEHFGLVGIAYVITEVARVFVQSGFGFALINKNDTNQTDECSVFYFNIAIGAFATSVIFLSAPIIGKFYNNPSLIPVIKFLALNIILGSFGSIQTVLLTKKIEFRQQTKASISATLISGIIGVILAFLNFEVWALVFQTLIRTLLHTIFLWFVHSWRPKILFSFASLKKMFGFGSRILLNSIIQIIFNNLYMIIIGKIYNPIQLGYFTRASQTQKLPLDTIWTIIGRVSFPVMSKMKDNSEKFIHVLTKASINISFLVFPSLINCTIIAPLLFRVLFGEKWNSSISMFQILCIGNIFLPMEQLKGTAILAKGHSNIHLNLQIFRYITMIVSVLFSLQYGINGMLLASGVSSYINFFLTCYYVEKKIGYKLTKQFTDIIPYILCAVFSGIAVMLAFSIKIESGMLKMIFLIFVGLVTFLTCSYAIKLEALSDNLEIFISFISKTNIPFLRKIQFNSKLN